MQQLERRRITGVGARELVQIEREMQRRLGEWRETLRRHPLQARPMLRTLLVGRITFTPTATASR